LFTSLALLSSFGRETSLVKIMGPRSIFTSLFTPSIYFQSLLSVPLLSLALILCKQQGRRNLQLLCTRWEQSYLLCVQVHVNLVSIRQQFLAPLTPSCIFCESAEDKPWYLHCGKLPLHCISNLPLGVTNEGREAIKPISSFVAGDSSLQDRGVAHYLLSLLFSLVSLPLSFYFCVPYQKYQKYLLLPWVPMKTPSCVTSLVTTTVTLSAFLLLHLPLQHLMK